MKEFPNGPLVDVKDLKLGMFIHLELGWMAHPFPLSSFRLTAPEQIATIRTLGIQSLRWSPEKSSSEIVEATLADTEDVRDTVSSVSGALAPVLPIETAEAAARRLRKRQLTAQRDALRQCETQLGEASRECKRAFDLLSVQPQQARQHAESLAGALLGKMTDDRDLSIRLLSEGAGDKAALHALNVTVISLLMARVFGLDENDLLDLGVGALMHDIGKSELPDRVRYRDEHFTTAELQFYQEHVNRGVALGRKMGLRPGALLVVAQHHEHVDGTGFPMKINSDRMSMASRIVALVNRYDNLCNPNLPSKALTPHESLSLLFAQGKNKFDTAIMGAFIRMMGVYPPGSAVQLTDDRYALVTAVNSSRPLKPRVLVHDPRVPRDEALLLDLEKSPALGIRRSVKPLQLPREALDYLSPRQRVVYFFEPARELETTEIAA